MLCWYKSYSRNRQCFSRALSWTITHRRYEEEVVKNRPAGYKAVCLCRLLLSTLLTVCHYTSFTHHRPFGRCRLVSWSHRRSILPRCTSVSWRKSKQRGNFDPCRPIWSAGEGWVRYWTTLCTRCCTFVSTFVIHTCTPVHCHAYETILQSEMYFSNWSMELIIAPAGHQINDKSAGASLLWSTLHYYLCLCSLLLLMLPNFWHLFCI